MPIALTTHPAEPFNSYASLEYLKARLDNQLRAYAAYGDEKLKAALIAATEYMDVRHAFTGYKAEKGQSRQFPRRECYDERGDLHDPIPTALMNACCEYAWRALALDLMPDPERSDTGRVVKSKSEKVGPLEDEVEYETSLGERLPSYPLADNMLYAARLVVRRGGITIGTLARG